MDRRHFLSTFSAAGAGLLTLASCGPIEVVEDPHSPRSRKTEGKIMGVVLYARRAALLRHHMGPSLRPWATNGVLVLARGASKGPYDLSLDHDHFVDRCLHQFHAPPPEGRMVRFKDPTIHVRGSQATFAFTTSIIDPTHMLVLRERYELWLSDVGWMIIRGRRWPLKERKLGASYRFTSMEWERRDTLARGANQRGDHRERVRQLADGWRFKDAWQAAQIATSTQGLSKEEAAKRWALRGAVAVEIGNANDAVKAFKAALKLDPKVKTAAVKAAMDARVTLGL